MTHYTNTNNPVDFPKLSTVDQLWGEALDRAVPNTYSSLTWTQVEKIKQVFAELIVQECLHVVKLAHSEGNENAYSYDDALDHAEYNIKQHFGVEE